MTEQEQNENGMKTNANESLRTKCRLFHGLLVQVAYSLLFYSWFKTNQFHMWNFNASEMKLNGTVIKWKQNDVRKPFLGQWSSNKERNSALGLVRFGLVHMDAWKHVQVTMVSDLAFSGGTDDNLDLSGTRLHILFLPLEVHELLMPMSITPALVWCSFCVVVLSA